MEWNKKKLLLITGAALAIGLIILVSFIVLNKAPTKQNSAISGNFNTIADSSTGLSFNMSKNFEPISREELAEMNPGFSYGFRAADDPNAICILSQTKLGGRGTTTAEELRDGIMGEVKKVHPDATIANEATALKPVIFGEAQGLLLEILYSEGSAKIKRVEVIALGKVNQLIAYCQSLASDNERYHNDFTIFFSSLELTS